MRAWTVLLSIVPGLFGAAGVALAAAGAHLAGTPIVTTAAYFLLFHAAALVGLCLASATLARPIVLNVAASLLAIGPAVFSTDLASRGLLRWTPLHFAAPVGGTLTIVGWLTLAFALPSALHRMRMS